MANCVFFFWHNFACHVPVPPPKTEPRQRRLSAPVRRFRRAPDDFCRLAQVGGQGFHRVKPLQIHQVSSLAKSQNTGSGEVAVDVLNNCRYILKEGGKRPEHRGSKWIFFAAESIFFFFCFFFFLLLFFFFFFFYVIRLARVAEVPSKPRPSACCSPAIKFSCAVAMSSNAKSMADM